MLVEPLQRLMKLGHDAQRATGATVEKFVVFVGLRGGGRTVLAHQSRIEVGVLNRVSVP